MRHAFVSILITGCGPAFTAAAGDGGTGTQQAPSLIDGSDSETQVDATVITGGPDGASPDVGANDGVYAGTDAAHPADAATDAVPPPDAPPTIEGGSACAPCPSGFDCIGGLCEDHAAMHFSATTNPGGNWSYGYSVSMSSAFVPFGTPWTAAGTTIAFWSTTSQTFAPSVFRNEAAAAATYQGLQLTAGQLGFWPGSSASELTILRWVPPAAASYSVTVTFAGVSYVSGLPATTTVVGLRGPGPAILWSQAIGTNGAGNTAAYTAPAAAMTASAFVEFFVDNGTNMTDSSDGTAIDALIVAK